MTKKWLIWLNIIIACLIGIFLVSASWLEISRPSEISVPEIKEVKTKLPPLSFEMPKTVYDRLGEPILNLKYSPPTLQIPDLRQQIIFAGKNGRPDANPESMLMHFTLSSSKTPFSLTPGSKVYLQYDRSQTPGRYVLSPQNAPTSLWIEAVPQGNDVFVKVGMLNDKGELVNKPEGNAKFVLQEKDVMRTGGMPTWELGKFRVDGTLLARQKARWYGVDRFIERHGGEELQDIVGKHRIDFGEGGDVYPVYVSVGDTLVWENEHWKSVKPGPDSLGRPLLVVKKIEDRIMNLELWDPEGKSKVVLNLLKSLEMPISPTIPQNFKFVGARTRSQFNFEVNKEKMTLSPHDWLLLTESGWKKLVTPEEIDDYVNRKTPGVLFVFDDVVKRDDKAFLVATLFNATRTDMQTIEIVLQQTGPGDKAKDGGLKKPSNATVPGNNQGMPFPVPPPSSGNDQAPQGGNVSPVTVQPPPSSMPMPPIPNGGISYSSKITPIEPSPTANVPPPSSASFSPEQYFRSRMEQLPLPPIPAPSTNVVSQMENALRPQANAHPMAVDEDDDDGNEGEDDDEDS